MPDSTRFLTYTILLYMKPAILLILMYTCLLYTSTEGDGLASDTIAETDATVLIPMTHGVDSLNVAAASAVAFWELAGRR